jgi:hypothetical protein
MLDILTLMVMKGELTPSVADKAAIMVGGMPFSSEPSIRARVLQGCIDTAKMLEASE